MANFFNPKCFKFVFVCRPLETIFKQICVKNCFTFRHTLNCGEHLGWVIDIHPDYGSSSKYQGTLGHKVNQKFKPATIYMAYESPR